MEKVSIGHIEGCHNPRCRGNCKPAAASAGYVAPEYVPRQVSMDNVRAAIDKAMAPFYEQAECSDFTIEDVDSAICHELNKL